MKQTDDIKVKEDILYVAGTMDEVPLFVGKDFYGKHFLIDNISRAIKSPDKSAMKLVAHFYNVENSVKREFAILPVKVTYEIIDG